MAGKKIKRKKKVLKPEEVETLTEQFVNFLKANVRWVVACCGMLLVISALLWAYARYTISRNEQAAYAYYISVKDFKSQDELKLEKSLSSFLKNYAGHPLTKMARLDEIVIFARQGKWDNVIKNCQQLLSSLKQDNPLYPIVLRHLAMAYTQKKDYRKALDTWKQLEKISPLEWQKEIYWNEGLILETMGKTNEAIENMRKALTINGILPDDFTIKMRINNLERKQPHKTG